MRLDAEGLTVRSADAGALDEGVQSVRDGAWSDRQPEPFRRRRREQVAMWVFTLGQLLDHLDLSLNDGHHVAVDRHLVPEDARLVDIPDEPSGAGFVLPEAFVPAQIKHV